ncbi:MAG: GAF domain-containing protein [Anaerolineales bacterium]|nr:GAF domain-containing protein [Anaerolineales bacterium]
MLLGIRWGSLRTKIIVWAFVPTAFILAAVALVNFFAYQNVTERLVIERDRELTRLAAGQLASELTSYSDLLNDLARKPDFYRGEVAAQQDTLRRTSGRLAVFDGGVIALDTFGIVMASEPEQPDILGQDWSQRPCYRQALRTQVAGEPHAVFTDVFQRDETPVHAICISVPILGEQGEFIGVLAGMFALLGDSTTLTGDITRLGIGQNGTVYLVDSSGHVLYHSGSVQIGADLSRELMIQQALAGESGAERTRDSQQQDVVASYAPVPGTPWTLVVEERWAVLTRASRGYQTSLLLLLGLGLVLPIIVVVLGVRHITAPVKDLIRAARDVAGGDFGQTISAQTGDEIEELARQFNVMSSELRESYANLEQHVEDRTRHLAALNAIATTVSRSLDIDQVLSEALDKTLVVMEVETGGIYLLDERSGTLRIASHRGLNPELVSEIDRLAVGEGFSGRVVQSGEPIVVADIASDARLTRIAVQDAGLHTLVIAPLSAKGRVLGTLFAMTRSPRQFSKQDVQLLTSIGSQIGVALENASLFEHEQRRSEQFGVVGAVSRHITSFLAIEELLGEIVHSLMQTFGYYLVSIGLIEGDELVFKAGAKAGWPGRQFRPMPVRVGEGSVTGWVAASGEPLLAPDVSQEPHFMFWPEAAETRSELAVPLKSKSGVIGVLNVESDQLNAFDESDKEVLQLLANQAAIAIENARNYEQAQRLAVFEERARLARELHDAVTQTLFSATLIAETLPVVWASDTQEGQEMLRSLRQLNRGALAEMRTLLLELRPGALIEANLSDLLRQLAEGAAGRTGIPVTVEVEGQCTLSSEVQVALYRISQEALNNVVKHAAASQVSVALRCAAPTGGSCKSRVELQVCDNGRGFDPSDVSSKSLGLEIMRERAEAIGAKLTIDTQADCGTRVTVVWLED